MDLIERLQQPNCTEQDVLAYLHQRSKDILEQGGDAMPVHEFWAPGDLERYRAAEVAWAKDASGHYGLPTLQMACHGVAGPKGMVDQTFIQGLEVRWKNYVAWMRSQKRDPEHPNETTNERRARKAREAMARTRALRSDKTEPEQLAALTRTKQLYQAYMEACAAKRDAERLHKQFVADAWAAYQASKAASELGTDGEAT